MRTIAQRMIHRVIIDEFFRLGEDLPLADVRTPAEFEQGHVPGAFNLPLFTNEERVVVGTTYKQTGREAAILLGFDLTGPRWSGFIKEALMRSPDKKMAVHCWRGGMRSEAMAWALNLYGFEVYLIKGGYKSFRRWALHQFSLPYPLMILGGMTGCGKTKVLHELRSLGEQVTDLEDLAQHRGSTYGTMNSLVQPTQEQFENNLATQLLKLDPARRVWIENESSCIGKRIIPRPIWNQMLLAPLIDMTMPVEQRIENLANEYGQLDKSFLVACTERIGKRLGPLQTKQAIEAIYENRMTDFVRLATVYYDKTYRSCLLKRNPDQVVSVAINGNDHKLIANRILCVAHSWLQETVQHV